MARLIKDKSTVLVIDGVPYSLVKEEPTEHNNLCVHCDLADICCKRYCCSTLFKLCSPPSMGEDWFFKVDWDIADKQILDYLDYTKEANI